MSRSKYRTICWLAQLALPAMVLAADDLSARITAPHGFTVERVAGAPQLQFPMFAAWDDRGRLYVAESSGLDLYAELQHQTRRCRILRLEDRDGDRRFDQAQVFADRLVFPMGLVWRDGRLYVADPPDLVAFTDRDDDGRADDRCVVLSGFGHTDNGSLHGLIFGPDDRLYMTMGNPDGYRLRRADGTVLAGTNGALLRARADGSQPEVVARGFTNLVEVAFLPDGSIVGTDNFFQSPRGGLRDAVVHLVEGGLYPGNSYQDETPHIVTGLPLPPVTLLPTTGISGIIRYRGRMFPEAMRGNLFTAQHNTRTVARHVLSRQGSSWTSQDEDFLTANDPDFHPSDVLEDADGSLLVLDTGGWYVQHCPTGKIQPSKAPGGIYRVSNPGATKPEDPWGRSIDWGGAALDELVRRLGDSRPMVCDRAVAELARRSVGVVPAIESWLPTTADREARPRAAWLLARLPDPAALAALRRLVDQDEPELVAAAARGLAARGDRGCEPRLRELLSAPDGGVRLAAAEALAHCGSAACLGAIWEALAEEPDPFLEHALVYAASRHAGLADLASALTRPASAVQRAALLLLDQPPHRSLGREDLVARTGAADPRLRRIALEILQRHPEWADHAIGLIRGWLTAGELTPEQDQSLRSLVLAFQIKDQVAGLVARGVGGALAGVTGPRRRVLLESMRQSATAEVPVAWRAAVGRALADQDPSVRAAAAGTAAALMLKESMPRVLALADEASIDDGLRIELLHAVVRSQPRLSANAFHWLLGRLGVADRPIDQLAAAEVLARAHLTAKRMLTRLLDAVRANSLISPPRCCCRSWSGRPTSAEPGHRGLPARSRRRRLAACGGPARAPG